MTVKYTGSSLAKVRVEIVDHDKPILRCKDCGAVFSLMRKPGAKRMPKRWWRCHNGCNSPKVCDFCEKGVDHHLGMERACKDCDTDYFLCLKCAVDYEWDVFPCCLEVVPGHREGSCAFCAQGKAA